MPSISERLGRLTARERRVLLAGAIVSALILVGTLVVAPYVGQWRDREAAIAAKAEQLTRLETLVASRPSLEASERALREALDRRDQSLVTGTSVALAGSALQSLVRSYGERSRVSILRLQPAGTAGVSADDATDGSELAAVGLSLTARGDIYGLVDLLYYLQNGEKLLVIDELRVTGPGLRSEGLLSWTMRLRGFFQPETAS